MIYLKRFLFGLAVFVFTTVSYADKGTSVLAMPWTFKAQMFDHSYAFGWKVVLKRGNKSLKPFVMYSDKEHYVKYKKGLSAGIYEVFVKMVASDTADDPDVEFESFGEILITDGEVAVFPYVLGFTTEETEFNTVTHSAYSKFLDFDGRKKFRKLIERKIKGKKPIRWLDFEEEKTIS